MALRVAAIGRRDRQIVVVVDVAQIAGHVGMPAGQQEPGRAVVECCRRPTDRRVAGRAVCSRKSRPGRRMNGIRWSAARWSNGIRNFRNRSARWSNCSCCSYGKARRPRWRGHWSAGNRSSCGRTWRSTNCQTNGRSCSSRLQTRFRPMDAPDSSSAANPPGGRTSRPSKAPGNFRPRHSYGTPGIRTTACAPSSGNRLKCC